MNQTAFVVNVPTCNQTAVLLAEIFTNPSMFGGGGSTVDTSPMILQTRVARQRSFVGGGNPLMEAEFMATYQDGKYLEQVKHAAFDAEHNLGSETPFYGIYRCRGCGWEVVSEKGKPLPPQNHHTHTQQQGAIRWRLVVYADHKQK